PRVGPRATSASPAAPTGSPGRSLPRRRCSRAIRLDPNVRPPEPAVTPRWRRRGPTVGNNAARGLACAAVGTTVAREPLVAHRGANGTNHDVNRPGRGRPAAFAGRTSLLAQHATDRRRRLRPPPTAPTR